MEVNSLLKEITTYYSYLLQLEKIYKEEGTNRIEIHKEISRISNLLSNKVTIVNEKIKSIDNYWHYHAVGNRNYIELPDGINFMNTLLMTVNNLENKYAIINLKIMELLPDEERMISYLKFRNVLILSDKDTLETFKEKKFINHLELVDKLNKLATDKKSFVLLSNLINEYPGAYIKERIALTNGNDIILSINGDNYLDSSINKLVEYMTKYGSDFGTSNPLFLSNIINQEKAKKRVLNKNNYIKYNEE